MVKKSDVILSFQNLDQLMPMHVQIGRFGHILRTGQTIAKLFDGSSIVGARFLEVFEIVRPRRRIDDFADLRGLVGLSLRLRLRTGQLISFKGSLVPSGDANMLLLNLSFGLSVADAVRDYRLTNADFAPTDLAVEMLYLLEAKTAVIEDSRDLNRKLHAAHGAAQKQANSDMLTGLKNRRAMDHVLSQAMTSKAQFGLTNLDLDYFKDVNDTLGHAAGDWVLQAVAEILTEETRKQDTVARVGGDEFVLIFDDLVDEDQLTKIARRIVERLEEPIVFDGKTCRISGSIGFTMSVLYDTPNADKMLSDADVALYASKHAGRARATMITPEMLGECGSDDGGKAPMAEIGKMS